MALIDCPECKREVSNKAPTCPHCGYQIRKRSIDKLADFVLFCVKACVFFFIFLIVAIALQTYAQRALESELQESYEYNEDVQFALKEISEFESTGLLRKMEVPLNRAYVDPMEWRKLSDGKKERVGQVLYLYFEDINRNNSVVSHKDKKYSSLWSKSVVANELVHNR